MTNPIVGEALLKWGLEAQLAIVQEECAELIVAISHFSRKRITQTQLAEEVADVEIILECMRLLVGDEAVDAHKEVKLERLRERLDGC